jgi:hypothetical protein
LQDRIKQLDIIHTEFESTIAKLTESDRVNTKTIEKLRTINRGLENSIAEQAELIRRIKEIISNYPFNFMNIESVKMHSYISIFIHSRSSVKYIHPMHDFIAVLGSEEMTKSSLAGFLVYVIYHIY